VKDEYTEKSVLTLLDQTLIRREPFGVALVMGAWNFPVQLSLAPVVGAISAGNAVFVKPSELSSQTEKTIAKLMPRYMDKELVKVVTGGIPETTELLKLQFDFIFFTGSPMVGKIVGQAAAKHLTPCVLELGGKCPAFFDETALNEEAVRRLLWSKASNLGQTCVAPDYVICSDQVKDKLVSMFKKVHGEFFGEDAKKSKDLGRFVNKKNFDRVTNLLAKTKGKVALGGGKDADELFLDVTVVTDVKSDDSLMSEEIFGPVLPVVTISDVEEAINFVNAREKPLSLYIFSEDKSVQKKILDGTSSGSVCVNDALVQLTVESLPFGGVGNSGYGAYHGWHSYDCFSHKKAVLVRDYNAVGTFLGKGRFPPYSEGNIKMMNTLLKSRNLNAVRALTSGATLASAVSFGAGIAAAYFIWGM